MGIFVLFGLTYVFLWLKSGLLGLPTKGQVYGVMWRWRWTDNQISDLRCYCPRCESELVAPYENRIVWTVGELYNDNRLVCEHCPDDGTLIKNDARFRNPDEILAVVNGRGRVVTNMPSTKCELLDRAKREIIRINRSGKRGLGQG